MSMMRLALVSLALLITAPGLASAQALVDVAWLKANLGKPGIVILDVRSGAGLDKKGYMAGHIPGAVFTDYAKDGWREKNAAGVEGMLPPAPKLEKLIGRLGIGNDTHVVLVAEGRTAADLAAATRLYWTFKVLGHDKVSVLDGGFVAWIKDIDPRTKQPVNPLETADNVPPPRDFRARVRNDMLIGVGDVQKALAEKRTLVDNRPHDFFMGLNRSSAAKQAGTLPGARSLPEGWLTDNGGGSFRSKAELEKIYAAASVPTTGSQITFCNTGHWASLGWFVSSEILGNKDVKMYDGSMAEWTQDPKLPVVQHVNLK